MAEIVQNGDPVLRAVATSVPVAKIGSLKIQKVLGDMRAALAKCEDGVALAAPQIGVSLRIFIVSPKAYEDGENLDGEPLVYINPRITKLSSKKDELDEGCLSVRNTYGLIERSQRATIEAYDEYGEKFTRGAGGLLAEIFQHEVDHLEGALFIDRARDLRYVPPRETPKIAFFGTPDFAVKMLSELEHAKLTPALIVTAPDKPAGRGKKLTPSPVKVWAEERHVQCVQPEKLSQIKDELVDFDLFVVAAYGKIIPQSVLDLPKKGTLNVHPSLLPRHRGAAPIQQTILDGDQETGVCIMLLDAEMDHGPIIAQDKLSLYGWTPSAGELHDKLALIGGKLLARTIPKWLAGKITSHDQDHAKATYTKKISNEDARVEWTDLDLPETDRKIRAYHPWPGAFAKVKTKKGDEIRVKLLPGKRVIPEGKKEMSLEDFKRGNLA